jgi:uncharacterized protein (TIGR02453 family)
MPLTRVPLTGTAFDGIPDEGLAFLEDLEERNEREFFHANRRLYRERLLTPFTALLDAAAEELGPPAADHGPSKVFRIHRDLRFSKDKAPYHTTMRGYVAQRAPLPGVVEVGYFVSYGPEGLYLAGGMWHPARAELERLRAAIADGGSGPRLAEVLARAGAEGLEANLDPLRRVPRPYAADHPRAELLRARSVTLRRRHRRAPWLVTTELLDRVVEGWRGLAPLNQWLDQVLNPRGTYS